MLDILCKNLMHMGKQLIEKQESLEVAEDYIKLLESILRKEAEVKRAYLEVIKGIQMENNYLHSHILERSNPLYCINLPMKDFL